ncbi:MAG: hypothetical protein ACJ74H_01760 [Thermoanaerobaculia bacterium]
MIRSRYALLLVSLFAATSAIASWSPSFSSKYEELTVGESRVIYLRAERIGFAFPQFAGWICLSTKESVAHVEGGLRNPTAEGKVRITAIAPGEAWVRIRTVGATIPDPPRWVQIVVRPAPVSVSIVPSTWISNFGQAVTLTAVTEGSPHTFLWYEGHVGDTSHPLEVREFEVTVTTLRSGVAYYWVSVIGAQGTSSAEIAIYVKAPPRRRAAEH